MIGRTVSSRRGQVCRFVFCVGLCGWRLFAQASGSHLERYAQEGDRALAEGRYADAQQAYEQVRQLAPATAEVHAKLGIIYFQEGKFEQAVQALRQAQKLKPALPNADALLAMSLSELGRYTEALPGLEKAFRRSADPALKRMSGLQLERAYTGLQRDSKAVEVALELSRLYPDDPEVLYHTARLFGNFAYVTMRRLAEVAPQSVWRRQAAGEVYDSQGSYDLAIAEYRQVLALNPRHPGTRLRLGRALLARARQADSRGDLAAEAEKEFEQELQLDPTNANAAYELGELHRKGGQLAKAREYLESALKHDPDFEEAQIALGRVLVALGAPEAAIPHLRKAISLNSRDDLGYYALAQAYAALGNQGEQQKALAEFRRLRSQNAEQQTRDFFSRREVTKQEADPSPTP